MLNLTINTQAELTIPLLDPENRDIALAIHHALPGDAEYAFLRRMLYKIPERAVLASDGAAWHIITHSGSPWFCDSIDRHLFHHVPAGLWLVEGRMCASKDDFTGEHDEWFDESSVTPISADDVEQRFGERVCEHLVDLDPFDLEAYWRVMSNPER